MTIKQEINRLVPSAYELVRNDIYLDKYGENISPRSPMPRVLQKICGRGLTQRKLKPSSKIIGRDTPLTKIR